ncbi:MAG: twin-arginine translocation pathway signal protein [Rhodovibrionaceae bacterium]
MLHSRRQALAVIGGGSVLAATAGAAAFLTTRRPDGALAPWDAAGGYEEIRHHALSYALLAPNPHNRQPWLVDLAQPGRVVLYRDKARDLPVTDPEARQLTIGLGCFLELMVLAAAERGYAVDLELFPQGEGGPVAIADFRDGTAEPDPLFTGVLHRRSCKEPFEDRPIEDDLAAQLAGFGAVITEPSQVAELRRLTWEAWMVEATTPDAYRESVELMRFGKAEIEANPDGIDLGGPFLESLMLVGILDRESQLDPSSSGFKQGIEIYRKMLAATPAYVALTTPGNSRADQIAAGRRWLRLNLTTTALGLALHPVSQALQEYPEMTAPRARAQSLLAQPGETVQMLGRLGYGPRTPPTPRWPLETRIRNG